jgi:uncharacterized membrane protein YhaH (DUF805 family)
MIVGYAAGGIIAFRAALKSPVDGAFLFFFGFLGLAGSLYMAVILGRRVIAAGRLEITPDGFRYISRLRPSGLFRWNDASGFRRVRYYTANWIAFDFSGKIRPAWTAGAIRQKTGADLLLISDSEISDIDGAIRLLNAARERWKSADAPEEVNLKRPPLSLFRRLFFGRIARRGYWIGVVSAVALGVCGAILEWVTREQSITQFALAIAPIMIALLLASVAVQGRLRDLGLNVWLARLGIVAVVAIGAVLAPLFGLPAQLPIIVALACVGAGLLALGVIPGSPGRNAYGPPPR